MDAERIKKAKESLRKSWVGFSRALPMVFGVVLLLGIILETIPRSFYSSFFRGNSVLDPFLGAILGSISAGNPVTSYIMGGEFLRQGVSLIAVTAFIITWVSVGFIQLPIESKILGKKFAIIRTALSFAASLVVAFLTVLTLKLL